MIKKNAFAGIVRSATKIEPHELKATFLSFLFIFLLMFAYNILKPVRDAMAPDWSDVSVALLWTYNFFFSMAAVAIYGFAASRLRFRFLVPGVYTFFAISFVLFYVGASYASNADYIDKAFYVWISVFALFHVSVFWSLMSDLFTKVQAPRLFAFIASGASTGTIAGSAATVGLAKALGSMNLMLLAAIILVAIVPLIGVLQAMKTMQPGSPDTSRDPNATISGNPLSGFSEFVTNPYLFGIAIFIFLYTAVGSFAYFEIKNLLDGFDRDTNTQIWAGINLAVNAIAITTAMFATSRIATRFGLAKTLAVIPLLVGIGLLAIAGNPVLAAVIVIWVVMRSGNYAITRPAREMLYTVVDREARFKAKPVIDIVVYRGGDALAGWLFAVLATTLGLGLGALAAIGGFIALMWAFVGVYLGRNYDRLDPVETNA
ncbi:MAG: MFS transporter [Gammaproteobacteria bacterium]|nr:MFS transporter [Gammaproteobacteria bacterium]MDH4314015.1 MFS transporter [Gammaproteobacteria bacterium]MDH5214929.1 MFS transporter [Gammaproteobacteria bacterium]MDH5499762.1 MFS transporter [Gammaproteobacteria bacterium]